jgi:hypothetical protein
MTQKEKSLDRLYVSFPKAERAIGPCAKYADFQPARKPFA